MSDVLEILNNSIKRQLSLVKDDTTIYIQVVYDDKSLNRYPLGCWFFNECVLETFSPEEKQEAIRLISGVGIQYLPECVRPTYEAIRQKRLQQKSLKQTMQADYIRKYGDIPVFKEEAEEKDTKKRGKRSKVAK